MIHRSRVSDRVFIGPDRSSLFGPKFDARLALSDRTPDPTQKRWPFRVFKSGGWKQKKTKNGS
uniref:Uncharacterized protein n=1 Tax=Meloidogyne incognita TaxID=6306 RepID=A0A914KSD2_MELIC